MERRGFHIPRALRNSVLYPALSEPHLGSRHSCRGSIVVMYGRFTLWGRGWKSLLLSAEPLIPLPTSLWVTLPNAFHPGDKGRQPGASMSLAPAAG